MNTDDYLIGAIETLKRQIVVISDDYTILGSCTKPTPGTRDASAVTGQLCYNALYNLASPCANCPVKEVIRTGKPALPHPGMDDCTNSCLYAYPMEIKGSDRGAIVVLDFHLPSLDEYDERRIISNAFLRNLTHSAVDGVIAADMTGKILIFNRAATEITGYSKKEAFESLNIRNIYPEGDAYTIMEHLRNDSHGRKGVLRSYKQIAVRRDGSTVPISLNASIIYEQNQEIATIGFFHDLTESLRLEAELKRTQAQLLQAEKMSSLGKLAAGVAHQLNNPLGGITLFVQLMLEEHKLSDDAKNDLLSIQRDAERCSSIVKELLEFARQTNREVRPVNINTILARTLFLLRNQSIFQNIEISENYDQTLPQIPADNQQLNHVFMNIILNGADAMEGKGRLEINTGFSNDKTMVKIEICDTGPGIDENILTTIFEPFFTTKEEGKGTGLGLSMAYGIVEGHGGKIWAVNRRPAGTKFVIMLPLVSSKDDVHEKL